MTFRTHRKAGWFLIGRECVIQREFVGRYGHKWGVGAKVRVLHVWKGKLAIETLGRLGVYTDEVDPANLGIDFKAEQRAAMNKERTARKKAAKLAGL